MKRFWVGASFLLWTGIIIIAYYVVQVPNLTALAGLADTLWTLLVAALLLFNSYGLGVRSLNLLGLKSVDTVDRLLLSFGIGLGCLGLLGLGFSAAQLAIASLLTIFQIALAIFFISRYDAGKLRADLKALFTNLNLSFSQYGLFTKLAILLPWIFSFLLTLVPPFEAFDALLYHLAQPARILQDGGLRFVDNVPFWFPNLTENVYLWALALGSERAAQVIHFSWATLSALLLWHWAVKAWNIEIARKLLLLLAAIPSLPMLASWAYADMALAYYAVAALYTITTDRTSSTSAWLRVTGVLAGLAMGVKYTSFVLPLACGLLLLFRRPFNKAFASAAQFSFIALSIAFPWYVRNATMMGNPFYPFVFGGRFWDAFLSGWYADSGTGIGWNALQIFMLPLNAVLGHHDATFSDGRMGPLFLFLAPFTLWILVSRTFQDPARGSSLQAMGIFVALSFAAWTFGVINSSALWQSRLLFPALMLFAIPTALGWDALKQFDTSTLRISFLTSILIAIVLTLTIFDNGIFVLQRNPLAVAFGAQSRERYIERVNPFYAALMNIMDELPSDAYVYSLFEPRSYDLPRRIQPDAIVANFVHDHYLYHTSSEIIQHWKAKGYTHILVYERGLDFMLKSRPDRITLEVQETFLETIQGLKLISQTDDKVYTIYQIP
ncbi:MAG: hypothetical protein M3R47_08210 [Chloroflexota bacterium]|nr:hypothetical protein [Chloroflexota bacterium]